MKGLPTFRRRQRRRGTRYTRLSDEILHVYSSDFVLGVLHCACLCKARAESRIERPARPFAEARIAARADCRCQLLGDVVRPLSGRTAAVVEACAELQRQER